METQMKPVHPGAILREDVLKELGLSITKAAEYLNISRKHLSGIIHESVSIQPEMAVRLEEAFGIQAIFWLDMQNNFDVWTIKSSGKITGIQRVLAHA